MKAYVDVSVNEYSIHCLSKEQLRLIAICLLDVMQSWAREPIYSRLNQLIPILNAPLQRKQKNNMPTLPRRQTGIETRQRKRHTIRSMSGMPGRRNRYQTSHY